MLFGIPMDAVDLTLYVGGGSIMEEKEEERDECIDRPADDLTEEDAVHPDQGDQEKRCAEAREGTEEGDPKHGSDGTETPQIGMQ